MRYTPENIREQMAPLFMDCLTLENVVLPKSFCDIIK